MSTVTSDGPETRRDIYNKSAVNRRVGVWVVLGRLGKSIVVAAKGIEKEKRCSRAMIVTSRAVRSLPSHHTVHRRMPKCCLLSQRTGGYRKNIPISNALPQATLSGENRAVR